MEKRREKSIDFAETAGDPRFVTLLYGEPKLRKTNSTTLPTLYKHICVVHSKGV